MINNNMILKIKGVEEKSQMITIDDDCQIIDDISNQFRYGKYRSAQQLFKEYKGREVYAEYLHIHYRVDGYPVFKVNIVQLEREDKINKILN